MYTSNETTLVEKSEIYLHQDISKKNVLIVEDEPSFRTVMNHIFFSVDQNCNPIWVDSVEAAMEHLRSDKFNLVIADYLLNGPRNGLDLWWTCHKKHSEIPFLMISGMGVSNYLNKTNGFKERPLFLPKPFHLGECREVVLSLLTKGNNKGEHVYE